MEAPSPVGEYTAGLSPRRSQDPRRPKDTDKSPHPLAAKRQVGYEFSVR